MVQQRQPAPLTLINISPPSRSKVFKIAGLDNQVVGKWTESPRFRCRSGDGIRLSVREQPDSPDLAAQERVRVSQRRVAAVRGHLSIPSQAEQRHVVGQRLLAPVQHGSEAGAVDLLHGFSRHPAEEVFKPLLAKKFPGSCMCLRNAIENDQDLAGSEAVY
jgi:hypothetical protein